MYWSNRGLFLSDHKATKPNVFSGFTTGIFYKAIGGEKMDLRVKLVLIQ